MHIKFVPFGQGEAHEALGWVFKEHTPNGDGFIGGDLYQWAGEGFPVHPEPDVDAMRDDAIERCRIEVDYPYSHEIEAE